MNTKDYLDRVEEFLEGHDPNKKEMDLETKKLILNLLFKNIKIAHTPAKLIVRGEFFAPKACPERSRRVFIRTFGWPLVTVARDGAGVVKEDK